MPIYTRIRKLRFLLLFLTVMCVFYVSSVFAKTYTLAMEISPPFSSLDPHNNPQGLAIELISAIVDLEDNQLETIICPFARCLKLVERGEADFISGILKTDKRSEFLSFIEPAIFNSFHGFRFYQLNSSLPISSMQDLEKLTVGVQRGALHFEAFDNNTSITKISLPSIKVLIEMLQKGRIDTFVMPQTSAEQYLRENDQHNKIRSADLTIRTKKNGYIAMSKHSKHIHELSDFSRALELLKNSGRLEKILSRYQLKND